MGNLRLVSPETERGALIDFAAAQAQRPPRGQPLAAVVKAEPWVSPDLLRTLEALPSGALRRITAHLAVMLATRPDGAAEETALAFARVVAATITPPDPGEAA